MYKCSKTYSRLKSIIELSVILAILCFSNFVLAQVHPDFGQLKIENFSSKEYKSHPQNWAVIQDQKGLMYFGNNLGVLVYDGLRWDLIKTESESRVRSLDVSPKGKVFVGANGDFGYLQANERGRMNYISLRKLYNIDQDKIGEIHSVKAFDQGVYFMADDRIFFYNGKILKVWESKSSFQSAFEINGAFVVNELSRGLCKMLDDSLILLKNAQNFKEKRIYDLIEVPDGEPIILTENDGIFNLFKPRFSGSEVSNIQEKINAAIKEYSPYNGTYIKNKYLVLGTWGHGLLILDEEGDIVQRINTSSGLIDEVVTSQFIDKEGNLWITTSNGISKIQLNNSLSVFREKVNVNETVEKIVKFQGKLFLASHTGLYRWEEENKAGTFEQVKGINTECWDIIPIEVEGRSLLLVAGNNAIYQVDESLNVEQIVSCLPWTFHQLSSNPNKVYVGLDDGLMCLKYQEGSWIIQSELGGVSNTIYCMGESGRNNLWLGTLSSGVIRLELQNSLATADFKFDVRKFDEDRGLPEGGVFVCEYVGGILFGTSNGIYEYNSETSSFIEETIYKKAMGLENIVIHRMSEDPKGNLWTMAYWEDDFYLGYFKRNGSILTWHDEEFKPISKEVFHTIFHDENTTWLGGPEGLFRYEFEDPGKEEFNYQVLIRGVNLNKDSLDFAGNYETQNYGDSAYEEGLPMKYSYEFNSVSFSFSSQFHKYSIMNEYSHMLEGFDKDWSQWNGDAKSIYTNLHEGKYTFKVKARNAYGKESDIDSFSFIVLPPWYRTWWAYLIYGLASVVLVYFVVILYTKKLKTIIKERTAEVVLQKEEIEKQKDEVETQRKLLEIKNSDITSSLNYAKRLQEALLPNEKVIEKYLKENFILYKPKDIVSGDFYWLEHVNGVPGQDVTLFATVDCTGHGVPGAFVSVVGNGGLNKAVNEYGLREPAAILDKLNEIVVETLSQGDSELRDGMDISLCRFDFNKMEMQYAGANNSVYILRKGIRNMPLGLNGSSKFHKDDLCEIRANKQPIGYYEFSKKFVNQKISLQKGDVIYLFSDGFADQFGGPSVKKYTVGRFKNFLLSIYDQPMSAQRDLIEKEFDNWQGDEDQIDDVIVAGIKV